MISWAPLRGRGPMREATVHASAGNRATQIVGPGPIALWSMVAGGILWMVYGYFRFMAPQGPDVVWREDLGYSPILSNELFMLYNLPGVLALLLTLWAALSFTRALTLHKQKSRTKRAVQLLAVLAILFGLIAVVGQAILFDPLKTLGLALGTPLLGLAMLLAGMIIVRDPRSVSGYKRPMGPILIFLGLTGLFTLLLRPLMFALAFLPLTFGAAASAAFGAAWILLAFILRDVPEWNGSPTPRTAAA